MVNKVILLGNVGNDPEVKETNKGELLSFRIATSFPGKNNRTEWHNIKAFGRTAKFVKDYVRKGDMVFVEGNISYYVYEAEDGSKRTLTSIMTNNITKINKPKNEQVNEYIDNEPIEDDFNDYDSGGF